RLTPVVLLRVVEGAADQILVDARVVALDASDQLADEMLVVPLSVENCHAVSVLSPVVGTGSARNTAKLSVSCTTCAPTSSVAGFAVCCSSSPASPRGRRSNTVSRRMRRLVPVGFGALVALLFVAAAQPRRAADS